MIRIEISCDPSELDAHLRALSATRLAALTIEPSSQNSTIAVDLATPMPINISGPTPTKECEPLLAGTGAVTNIQLHEGAIVETTTDAHGVLTGVKVTQGVGAAPKLTAMDGDRERGKAGPGHRRRTDAQIKEDAEYFAQAHAAEPAPLPPGADGPLISTGGERISPEDAADEAAETAVRQAERGKLTLEDLRAVVGRYTDKFGVKASVEAIRTIVGKPIIEVKDDELADAIARVEAAITGAAAPAQEAESVSADKPTEPVHATKADVVEAFTAYGRKYDGVDDPKLMKFTQEDLPRVLEQTFGAGVRSVSKIPATPESYGRAMAAVYAAVQDNPFKREPKS